MDREIVFFTKGRLIAAHSVIERIASAFRDQPFSEHVQQAVYALNRADAALEAELAATDNQQAKSRNR